MMLAYNQLNLDSSWTCDRERPASATGNMVTKIKV